MSPTIELAKALIARASVTPEDAGCQELMIERLEAMGFQVERLRFGDVDNFWARRGTQGPLLAFAGHTDLIQHVEPDLTLHGLRILWRLNRQVKG